MERIPAQPWLPSQRLPPPLHTRLARARRQKCHICQHQESGQSSRETLAHLERARGALGKHLVAEKTEVWFVSNSFASRPARTTPWSKGKVERPTSDWTAPTCTLQLSQTQPYRSRCLSGRCCVIFAHGTYSARCRQCFWLVSESLHRSDTHRYGVSFDLLYQLLARTKFTWANVGTNMIKFAARCFFFARKNLRTFWVCERQQP